MVIIHRCQPFGQLTSWAWSISSSIAFTIVPSFLDHAIWRIQPPIVYTLTRFIVCLLVSVSGLTDHPYRTGLPLETFLQHLSWDNYCVETLSGRTGPCQRLGLRNCTMEATESRDIILCKHSNVLQCVSDAHPAYGCLCYVLLFPHGEHSWYHEMLKNPENLTAKQLSQTCYCAYCIYQRRDDFGTIL